MEKINEKLTKISKGAKRMIIIDGCNVAFMYVMYIIYFIIKFYCYPLKNITLQVLIITIYVYLLSIHKC